MLREGDKGEAERGGVTTPAGCEGRKRRKGRVKLLSDGPKEIKVYFLRQTHTHTHRPVTSVGIGSVSHPGGTNSKPCLRNSPDFPADRGSYYPFLSKGNEMCGGVKS